MANRIKLKGTSERSFDIGLGPKQTLDASGLTANRTWVLPDSDGSNGYVLSTNGTGTLAWVAQTGGGGTPGGTDTQVQFNDGGSFGGDSAFTWNKTSDTLTVAGDITSVDSITFDTTATETSAVAKMFWDDGYGMLQYTLKGGNYDVKIGEDLATLCYNGTGSSIAKGKVVYIAGAQGQRISVGLADNTNDTTSSKTFGLVAETFPDGSEKFVVTQGMLRNIDTSAYAPGTILWLGKNGNYTDVKPVAPDHLVFIGVVLKQNMASGEIYVKPQNGYELDEIHNVLITNPVADNSTLLYDTSTSLWVNASPSTTINAILPTQTGNSGTYLTTDGSTASWATAVSSINLSGGTTGLTTTGGPITTTGTITLTGTVVTTHGGTGLTSYTTGDILYASNTNTLSKLGIGATGTVLTVSGGVPSWAAAAGGATSWPNGTAAAPGWPNTVTTSTGIYSTAPTTTINFAISGREAFRITGSATSTNTIAINSSNTGVTPTITNVGSDTSGAGLGITINARDAALTGSGINGAAVSINGGAGYNNGTGGAINITAGPGGPSGAAGTGGNVNISSGPAQIGGGNGGNQSGNVNISTPGDIQRTTGNITIGTGNVSSAANTGALTLRTGDVQASTGNAGAVSITAGSGFNSSGGGVIITAGSIAGAGTAGSISLAAGNVGNNALGGGTGGNITFTTGGQTISSAESYGGYPGSFTFTIGRPGGRALRTSSVAPSWTFNNTTPFGSNLAEANGLGGSNFIIACSDGQSTFTTSSGANRNGGKGGSFTLTCGAGGAGTNPGSGTADGGAGGDFTVTCGAGGTGSKNVFGVGGGITFTPGRSGGGSSAAGSFSVLSPATSSAMVIAGTAGTGSSIVLNAGPGANNTTTSGTTQGGRGGNLTSTLGAGGTAIGASATGTGGQGGSYSFNAGTGGEGITNCGAGGTFSLTGGAGAATALATTAGAGGGLTLLAGSGGFNSATTGTRNGGAGSNVLITSGTGGNAATTSGTGNGGAAGDIRINAGIGGIGNSTGTDGLCGNVYIRPGATNTGRQSGGSFIVEVPSITDLNTAGTAGTGTTIILNTSRGANNTTSTGVTQGGTGGSLTATLGNGGTATGASATGTGGKGGSYNFTAGNGGDATTTGGAGGDYSITLGSAGTGGNAAAGQFRITGGTATGTGAISTATFQTIPVVVSGGYFSRGVPVTETGDFTLTLGENWVIVDNPAAVTWTTVTLPAASSQPGREIMFQVYPGSGATLRSASANVIPFGGGSADQPIAAAGTFATIVSDGTNWIVMQRG